ncbi:MAG: flagellar motor protein MotB [Alphaproteobacteria bacterium]|nr:flagellar motor protein MotB [Alphaproteobacteria bacterium]
MADSNLPPIIVKKRKHGGHEFHGGHWKVALADFMTAMFIIFLMLWLVNQVKPEVREGIAEYFAPASIARTTSGSGAPLGGQTITQPGMQRSQSAPLGPPGGGPSQPQDGEGTTEVPGFPGSSAERVANATRFAGNRDIQGGGTFEEMGAVRKQLEDIPELRDYTSNIQVEMIPEGLRINLIDSDRRELFGSGSATPLPHTRQIVAQVARVIERLPNRITIAGHTDSRGFAANATYTNWELSADRANSTRRLLMASGVRDERVIQVQGRADRDHLMPDDPNAPGNRRISITVLRESTPPRLPPPPSAPAPGPAPDGPLIRR